VQGDTELAKQIRALDNTLYGKLNLDVKVTTSGLPQDFVNHLSGPINASITGGRLVGSNIAKSLNESLSSAKVGAVDLGKVLKDQIKLDFSNMSFNDLSIALEAQNGKLLVKNFDMKAGALGTLLVNGTVGFDGALDLALDNALSTSVSGKIKSNQVMAAIAPQNKAGNVMLYFNIGGTLSSPKVTLNTTKMASGVNNIADALKDKAKAAVDEAKAKAQAAIDDATAKAEAAARAKAEELKAQAQKKADEVKAKAEAAAKKKADEVKSKAKDKAKDLLKGFKK
jgi:hypothetical protein